MLVAGHEKIKNKKVVQDGIDIHCRFDELVDPKTLKPHPKNRNKHPKDQIERLTEIMRYNGVRRSITVSTRTGNITVGHGRRLSMMGAKMKKVPVVYQDYEDEEHEYADIQADNAVALWAELDLVQINDDLLAFESDFPVDMLGIKDFELTDITEIEEHCDPDEVPEQVDTRAKEGDLWILGDHKLVCGSSTDEHTVTRLLDGQKPNTMITDPPYGVEYEAGWRAKAKGVKATEREKSSNLKNDNKADWYDAYALHPGSVAYVWHASAFTDVVMDGLRRAGFDIKAQIIWNKNVHALSRSDYQWKHEPCWYAIRTGSKNNWQGDRKQKTVWDIPNVMFEKDGGGKTSHPTQKPVEIYTRAISNHTNPGEYIYEPFGGSGTAIIACEKTGRRSLTVELGPKYCDVILTRWEKYTGKTAKLAENSGDNGEKE